MTLQAYREFIAARAPAAKRGGFEPKPINANAKATHQSVVDVMQAAQTAGYPRISFATQSPH